MPTKQEDAPRTPDLIFLNVSHEFIRRHCIDLEAGEMPAYRGPVQLMSNRGDAVLEYVKKIGVERGLKMLPPLTKPFDIADYHQD